MKISTIKEIKVGENRVGLTPHGVDSLVSKGHKVFVEIGAGVGSGFSDEDYKNRGGKIVSREEAWNCEMVVKVKEPQENEYEFLSENKILFTYLHLAAEQKLTKELLDKKVIGIAYETVEYDDGTLPLLTPMSEVAGRLSVQMGAHYLEKTHRGSGKLLGGVPGVLPANVTVLGSGVAGLNSAKMSLGLGANVTVIGRNLSQLKYIDEIFNGQIKTLMSNNYNIEKSVETADLLIGTVSITGYKAPKLVTREMIKKMKKGSVVVDISIDQGGSFETSKPTSHENPVYEEEGVIHYCVTNMPGAVPNTSTLALTNATLPYVLKLASGLECLKNDKPLFRGVNTYKGKLTNKGVAEAFGIEFENLDI